MKKKTLYIIVGVCLVPLITFAYLFYFSVNESDETAVLLPRSTDTNSSSEFLNAQRTVDYFREQIEKHPDDPQNYVGLAQVFLQEARVTGKHHEYLPKIMSMLDHALSIDKENLDANLTKASLLLTLHQFEEARKIGHWAITRYPYNSSAYGVLVDACTELGDYCKAIEMCDNMLNIRPDLRAYARASYLRELHGETEAAIAAMRMAADAGVTGQENRAWVLYNLGNLYLMAGKTDTADFIYNGILKERPGYAYALAGLSKVNVIRGDYKKAIEYLNLALDKLDDHTFIEQLADMYMGMNRKFEAQKFETLALAEFKEHENSGWNIDREFAVFCLNHNLQLEEALSRAKKEYKRRPLNIDVIDTYAWALYKNGKISNAADIIGKALRLNTSNALLYYHAGIIHTAIGKKSEAINNLELALKENLSAYILFYRDAREKLVSLKEFALADND